MAGLLNETPQYLPFSSIGPRAQRVLTRAQNKAYEPYQEAQQRGADWINYNPFIIMDSMYRAGQEGIGETIRQVGDAFGYPDQGKEVARGINSGIEYLASRGGSDFPTPGFGIPIERNPATRIETPKTTGAIAVHGGKPQVGPWNFGWDSERGMWMHPLSQRHISERYASKFPDGEVRTYELPPKDKWLVHDWGMKDYPPERQDLFRSLVKKHNLRGESIGDISIPGYIDPDGIPRNYFEPPLRYGEQAVLDDLIKSDVAGLWGGLDDGSYTAFTPEKMRLLGKYKVYDDVIDPSSRIGVHGGARQEGLWDFGKTEESGHGMWMHPLEYTSDDAVARYYSAYRGGKDNQKIRHYEMPDDSRWIDDRKVTEYPRDMQDSFRSIADKYGLEFDPSGRISFLDKIDNSKEGHAIRRDLSDAGIAGSHTFDPSVEFNEYIAFDPDRLKLARKYDPNKQSYANGAIWPRGMFETPYRPFRPSRKDYGYPAPFNSLLGAGALSTQDAPLSFPRRR